jgi:hypothetical protein
MSVSTRGDRVQRANGVDLVAKDEAEAIAIAKKYLSFQGEGGSSNEKQLIPFPCVWIVKTPPTIGLVLSHEGP